MTEPRSPSVNDLPAQRAGDEIAGRGHSTTSSLVTEHGRTTIAPEAVSKIAGVAAREISGVHDFGTSTARAFGAIKDRLGVDESVTRGIDVEVGERQAAADIALVVDYGVAIPDLAGAVRRNVISAIEHMCGLEVTEVNIAVDDVHLPQQEEPAGSEGAPRVE